MIVRCVLLHDRRASDETPPPSAAPRRMLHERMFRTEKHRWSAQAFFPTTVSFVDFGEGGTLGMKIAKKESISSSIFVLPSGLRETQNNR
jgi:hypothetical protein